MTEDEECSYGTRWGVALCAFLPAALVVGCLGALISTGALAAGLVVQGGSINVATSSVYGTNFGAALVDQTAKQADGTTKTVHVLRLGFANGQINGLCLTQRQSFLGATYTVMIKLGDSDPATWEITTKNVVMDIQRVNGTLDMDGVVDLNVNGPDVTTIRDASGNVVPNPLDSPQNRFGIQGRYAKFDQITGDIQDLQIPGVFNSPSLDITITPGVRTCPAPAAPSGTP
ncbi:DUF6230 family protein [Actinocorallia sp. API 0066]|uniref:DUF6230 family protein n=1 Tax=Actinocorallia sp. API 0066 TaxID=2896846 RepID=UPI001E412B24|nr:DUF6230 family protein [Actinocorallia sp. API 0066]MCD0451793.1 DUF6230 family protein [Actinocorallia sp. API 0066]